MAMLATWLATSAVPSPLGGERGEAKQSSLIPPPPHPGPLAQGGEGAHPTASPLVSSANPVATKSIPGDFFSTHPISRVEIELSPQSLANLRASSREYVRANVRVNGEAFPETGVHLKGSTGSFRPLEDKPGLTLDFEKFSGGGQFPGGRKIHLNNSVEDPSYLQELLAGELFRATGVPAPRVAHALVTLNGRALGLYVLKEGFTPDFLGQNLPPGDGNLYEPDRGQDVDHPMERRAGKVAGTAQASRKRLAAAAAEPDRAIRWARLQAALDTERFARFLAMEVMLAHWDGYGLGRNNFRVYVEPAGERVIFLPTGMDQLFAKADLPWRPSHFSGLVARAFMDTPAGRQRYEAAFRDLFAKVFDARRLGERVREVTTALRPFLAPASFQALQREAGELIALIAARETSLRRQLAEPEPAAPDFLDGNARLAGWQPFDPPAGGGLREGGAGPSEPPTLRITAGTRTAASWRTTARLTRGHYRLAGRARVFDVAPLPFGKTHGAGLRVGNHAMAPGALTGSTGWEKLGLDFEVTDTQEDVVLICELRASAGEAWFDKDSLTLTRLP